MYIKLYCACKNTLLKHTNIGGDNEKAAKVTARIVSYNVDSDMVQIAVNA